MKKSILYIILSICFAVSVATACTVTRPKPANDTTESFSEDIGSDSEDSSSDGSSDDSDWSPFY